MWERAGLLLEDLLAYKNSKKDPIKQQIAFFNQLGILIDSGIPILVALDNISTDMENPELTNIVAEMTSAIQEGQYIAPVLLKHSDIFDPLASKKIAQAEQQGKLNTQLLELAMQLKQSIP